MQFGTLFTVSAPSGAGKTSLVTALTKADPGIRVSVSHTTRAPRPGEHEGINYHFVDPNTFKAMIRAREFLEYAEVFGNYYGTSAAWSNEQLAKGQDVLLEIDWQGAAQIKNIEPQTISIFILPPSTAALKHRLINRGQDSDDVIQRRLAEAKNEMQHAHRADFIIINDNFDQALEDLKSIFVGQRLRATKQQHRYKDLLNELTQ